MKPWNRRLWGIAFTGADPRDKPMLIGTAWMEPGKPERYPGEPSRALLFFTREAARGFCRQKKEQYQGRQDACSKWKFTPVRVREIVTLE